MDGTKTSIWRGGLANLLRNDPQTAKPESTTQVRESIKINIPIILRDVKASQPSAALSDLHSTRIMPIERLLPESARPALEQLRLKQTAVNAAPVRRKRKLSARWWQYPMLAFTTLLAVSAWMLPPLLEQSGVHTRAIPLPITTPEAVQTPVERVADVALQVQPTQQPQAAASPTQAVPPQLERAAVDALIAGDYANAQRMYDRLAAAKPDVPAFSVAARVLGTQMPQRK
ncbi:MAG: hypothetical protein RL701_2368 [Pseudomonadota bacterium]